MSGTGIIRTAIDRGNNIHSGGGKCRVLALYAQLCEREMEKQQGDQSDDPRKMLS